MYQPKAYVAPHKHRIQEQIYHVLDGEGLMEIEGERTVVRRDDVIFIPPGVEHAIYNTGHGRSALHRGDFAAGRVMEKILLLQGANMSYLGRRQPELYGTTTAASST